MSQEVIATATIHCECEKCDTRFDQDLNINSVETIFYVGTWKGRNAIKVAVSCPKCYGTIEVLIE